MIFPRRILLLCALVAALALSGCTESDGSEVPEGAAGDGGPAFENVEPDAITLGVLAGGEALPLLVADHHDLFSAAGVEARIVRFDTAEARDAALTLGEIDAFVGGIDSAAALEAAGTQVAMVSVVAEPALTVDSTATPVTGLDPAAFGLGDEGAYLVISDRYIALPSGLLAARAVLEALDAAVVRIQGDPGAYRGMLAEAAGRDDVVVAGEAYPASASPGVTEVGRLLQEIAAAQPGAAALAVDDLVLDIGR